MSISVKVETKNNIPNDVVDFVVSSLKRIQSMSDGNVFDVNFVFFKSKQWIPTREVYKAVLENSVVTITENFIDTPRKFGVEIYNDTVSISYAFDHSGLKSFPDFQKKIRQQFLDINYVGDYRFEIEDHNEDADRINFVKKLLNFQYHEKVKNADLFYQRIEPVRGIGVRIYKQNNRVMYPRLKIKKNGEAVLNSGPMSQIKSSTINIPDHIVAEFNALNISKTKIHRQNTALKRMTRWTSGF